MFRVKTWLNLTIVFASKNFIQQIAFLFKAEMRPSAK